MYFPKCKTIVNIAKCDLPQRIHILWLIEHELLPKTIHASYYIMIFMLRFVKYSIENYIWIYSQITIQTKLKLSFETILWNISMQIQLKSFHFMFNSTAHQFPSPSQVFICLINSSNVYQWNMLKCYEMSSFQAICCDFLTKSLFFFFSGNQNIEIEQTIYCCKRLVLCTDPVWYGWNGNQLYCARSNDNMRSFSS